MYERSEWLIRPLVMIMIAILVNAVVIPIIKKRLAKKNFNFDATAEARLAKLKVAKRLAKYVF